MKIPFFASLVILGTEETRAQYDHSLPNQDFQCRERRGFAGRGLLLVAGVFEDCHEIKVKVKVRLMFRLILYIGS